MKLKTYKVFFSIEDWPSEDGPLFVTCLADDEEHAKEQCSNVYPKSKIINVQLLENAKKKHSTLMDISFVINHECEDPHDIPIDELLNALEKRLEYLKANRDEVKDAIEAYDTYEY